MKVELLLNDCSEQVLPISEGIAVTRANLNIACLPCVCLSGHTWARRVPRVATVHNVVKETIRVHLTVLHVFHAYASADTPWVAHALSHFTLTRYGRIASISAAHEVTQFVGPHKIPYAPVHNSNLLTGARRLVLNRHRRRLSHWSSKFQIKPLPFLRI
jgi:hypothetical protein